MLEKIMRLLSSISVEESNNIVKIKGIPGEKLLRDMEKVWGTSRIGLNFFNEVGRNHLIMHSFFLPDFVYVLRTLLSHKKAYRVGPRIITKIIDRIYTDTWLKSTQTEYNSMMNKGKLSDILFSPLDHQEEFIKTYDQMVQKFKLKGYLLAAAPGSGKTLTSIFLSHSLEADVFVAVVPPNSIDRVWRTTLNDCLRPGFKVWDSRSNDPLEYGYTHYVFHYESLEKAVIFFDKVKQLYKKPFVVLDECHNFNDMSSARTQYFIQLCSILNCNHVLWMSGTPVKAMGSEVISLMTTIDSFFNKDVADRFKKIFGVSVARGLDILANRIGFMSFKIEKAKVVGNVVEVKRADVRMSNGQEYTLAEIRVKMSKFIDERLRYYKNNMGHYVSIYKTCLEAFKKTIKTREEHDEYLRYEKYANALHGGLDPMNNKEEVAFCNNYENKVIIPNLPSNMVKDFRNSKSVYKYYYLKVQGEALGRILGKQREQCNVDIVRNTTKMKLSWGSGSNKETEDEVSIFDLIDSSEKKTIIFTSYVAVVDEMFSFLEENGYKPMKVYADTNKNLSEIIKSFEKDEDINPLIATFDSLSTAVPLIMANTVILMNSPFRAHEYDQTVSRVDRLGQTEIVRVVNVFLDTGKESNISTRSNDIIKWSREQVAAIMNMEVSDVAALESISDVCDTSELIPNIKNENRPGWLDW